MFGISGKTVRIIARVFLVLLWLSTLVIAACWMMGVDTGFEPEPVTVVLGLISTAVTALLLEYANLLEAEEYSLSYALAYGYVNNFIEPVVTRLVDMAGPGEHVVFYIYIPEHLSELYPRAIERTMAKIRKAGFHNDVINLDLEEGRARDIMTVFADGSGDLKYFDFPNTLLTLASLVNYKVPSGKDSFDDDDKDEMGRVYIKKFEEEVRKLVEKKEIADHVDYTDKNLDFLK